MPETEAPERYVLRLYVSGATQRSTAAVASLRENGETHLEGRFDLQAVHLISDYENKQVCSTEAYAQ
jgi:hypothetical protein